MRKVTIYRTSFTDVEDGEYVDPDTDSEDVCCEPDEGESAVGLAVEAIEAAGCGEPSTMPGFHVGIWYSDPDGSYVSDYRTGERVATSAHLHGFSENEEREIHERITAR